MVVCKWYICTGKNGDQEQGRISEGVGKSDTMLICVPAVMDRLRGKREWILAVLLRIVGCMLGGE